MRFHLQRSKWHGPAPDKKSELRRYNSPNCGFSILSNFVVDPRTVFLYPNGFSMFASYFLGKFR